MHLHLVLQRDHRPVLCQFLHQSQVQTHQPCFSLALLLTHSLTRSLAAHLCVGLVERRRLHRLLQVLDGLQQHVPLHLELLHLPSQCRPSHLVLRLFQRGGAGMETKRSKGERERESERWETKAEIERKVIVRRCQLVGTSAAGKQTPKTLILFIDIRYVNKHNPSPGKIIIK